MAGTRTNQLRRTLLMLGIMALAPAAHAGGDAANGEKLSATCASCHGSEGVSIAPNFPNLAGQYADYLAQALRQYQNGKRKNAVMAGLAAGLSEQDIRDLAAFYASKTGLRILPLD